MSNTVIFKKDSFIYERIFFTSSRLLVVKVELSVFLSDGDGCLFLLLVLSLFTVPLALFEGWRKIFSIEFNTKIDK